MKTMSFFVFTLERLWKITEKPNSMYHYKGTSVNCRECFEYGTDGAQKPECPDKSGHEDFDPDRSSLTKQLNRGINKGHL